MTGLRSSSTTSPSTSTSRGGWTTCCISLLRRARGTTSNIPIQTLKVGSLGTHKALGLALAKDATLLLASTCEVYGDPEVHPQREDYWGHVNPIGLRGVYDEAKRFAEAMTMAYHRTHNLDTKIARIFNTYGPRMRLNDGRALPAFMSRGARGQASRRLRRRLCRRGRSATSATRSRASTGS